MAALHHSIADVLIIGAGPAGLSAALTCARGMYKAIVFDSGEYRNEGVKHMHTIASRDHSDPAEFRRITREQIESRYHTIRFQHAKITNALSTIVGDAKHTGFELKDSEGHTYLGRKLVLATGSKDIFPDITGYTENWPEHIYQCLACDGYEQRGTPIGVLGFESPMAVHFVQMAVIFDPRVTIFSNGPVSSNPAIQAALEASRAFGAKLDERPITRLINNGPSHTDGVTIEFTSGEPITLGFIVNRPALVNRAQHLLDQLGIETVDAAQGGHVKIANPMFNETNVRGVFAAGDTMVMMKQVAIALGEGQKAAIGAAMQLGQEKSAILVEKYREGLAKAEV